MLENSHISTRNSLVNKTSRDFIDGFALRLVFNLKVLDVFLVVRHIMFNISDVKIHVTDHSSYSVLIIN